MPYTYESPVALVALGALAPNDTHLSFERMRASDA